MTKPFPYVHQFCVNILESKIINFFYQKQRALYQRQAERDAAREERRKALRKKHEVMAAETQAMLEEARISRKENGTN